MEFDKVKKERILRGMKDYKEKGLSNGFGLSTTYNLVYKGENYQPKAVKSFANFRALVPNWGVNGAITNK
jgi:hypothetical protein